MSRTPIIHENILFLRQGIDLLGQLDDEIYVKVLAPYFGSGVGKHIRHNLDHYESFLAGLAGGNIDYDSRQRDPMVETDRHHAIQKMLSIIARLEALAVQRLDRPLLVKMNDAEEVDNWNQSTIGRELQFLMSHTVHHYALVAIILKIQGFHCAKEFGVAPSTLRYQRSQAATCVPSPG